MSEPDLQEMEEHCEKYACQKCPIKDRCPMFKKLFKWRGKE